MDDLTIINEENKFLKNLSKDKTYEPMIKHLSTALKKTDKTSENFYKTQSNFMDNNLTVTQLTPIRSIRQILAEINKSKSALQEAFFKNALKMNDIKKHQRSLKEAKDELVVEELQIKVCQLQNELARTDDYVKGAIRKITNYTQQYESILKDLGVKDISELEFEQEEEKYHIKRSFQQALSAARANRGIVDTGNLEYFTQIGVNASVAQRMISNYLQLEQKLMDDDKEPTHKMELNFLEEMGEKFKGVSDDLLEAKGMFKNEFNLLKDKEEK